MSLFNELLKEAIGGSFDEVLTVEPQLVQKEKEKKDEQAFNR